MNKRTLGIILIVLGMIGAVVSVIADVIGIGTYAGIYWAQLLGVAVGLVVAVAGAWLVLSRTVAKK